MLMQFEIDGFVFDGETSQRTDATLVVNESGVVSLRRTSNDHHAPLVTKISTRLGNSARYIEIENIGRFETQDNDGVDKLAKLLFSNDDSTLIHKLESNLALIVVAIFITVAFVGATVKWGVPSLADYIVDVMPDKASDIIGDTLTTQIEERWFEPSTLSEARQAELHKKFDQVLSALNSSDKGYVFKLKDAEDSVGANALAFPSGTIIMTDQLVKLADNDQQLMGIMAHEIGHLDGKHSLRQIVRGSIITFLVAFISGDISGASSTLITAPVVLLELNYSREFEVEADGYALKYFNCDTKGLKTMGEFFKKLESSHTHHSHEPSDDNQEQESDNILIEDDASDEEEGIISNFLSTHPGSKQREKYFLNHIQNECGG